MRDISSFNETDVREDILSPLIKSLGYATGTDNDVIREATFRYPLMQLGRPSKNDKPITGRPDYICTVRGAGRWVLEAKAAFEAITAETIHQAFTYANHHDIAAIFFALSNGKCFLIFRTAGGPFSKPILDIELEGNDNAEAEILNFLSPDSIRELSLEVACKKISEKSKNFQIISGEATFENSTYELHVPAQVRPIMESKLRSQSQQLIGTIYPLRGGNVICEDNKIFVNVELGAPSLNDEELQQRLGIDKIHFQTVGNGLSEKANEPTILESVQTVVAKAGENFSSTRFPNSQIMPYDFPMEVKVDAVVFRNGDEISGKFYYTVAARVPQLPGSSLSMQLTGRLILKCR